MSESKSKNLLHGIDLYAPGGVEQLLAFHRCTFGDAVMSGNGDGGSGESGAGGAGGGNGEPGGQSGQGQGDPAPGQSGAGGDPGAAGKGGEDDEQLGEPGKRALLAERTANRQLKDDLAARDQRIRELEDKDKSEEQRRDERLQQLEGDTTTKDRTIEKHELTILRYQVAAEKGLDLSAAERLQGATKEEVQQDADAWIAKWGTGGAKSHVQDPGQGGRQQTAEDPWQAGRDRAAKRFGSENKN